MKKSLFIALCLLVVACIEKPQKPTDILSQQKMAHILLDIHIQEAQINSIALDRDKKILLYREQEPQIFAAHQVDTVLFNKSYQYYLQHLSELKEIYTQVNDSLTARKARSTPAKNAQKPTPSTNPKAEKERANTQHPRNQPNNSTYHER